MMRSPAPLMLSSSTTSLWESAGGRHDDDDIDNNDAMTRDLLTLQRVLLSQSSSCDGATTNVAAYSLPPAREGPSATDQQQLPKPRTIQRKSSSSASAFSLLLPTLSSGSTDVNKHFGDFPSRQPLKRWTSRDGASRLLRTSSGLMKSLDDFVERTTAALGRTSSITGNNNSASGGGGDLLDDSGVTERPVPTPLVRATSSSLACSNILQGGTDSTKSDDYEHLVSAALYESSSGPTFDFKGIGGGSKWDEWFERDLPPRTLPSPVSPLAELNQDKKPEQMDTSTTKKRVPKTAKKRKRKEPSELPPKRRRTTTKPKKKCSKPKKSKHPAVMEFVEKVTDLDVLLGRGGETNHHPGNKCYLKEKDLMQERYLAASKTEKTGISQELVDRVHKWGGKFLDKDPVSGRRYVISNLRARKKASQTLREINTPEVRAARRRRYGK